MTRHVIELFAVLACTLFTGAAIYITAVEHPARLSCGAEIAVAQWVPSYRRATIMQASLAIIAGFLGLVRGLDGSGGALWIAGAILILAVVPFTLIVIRPTNNQLLHPRGERGPDETLRLLTSWGRLHLVRSGLSAAASILFIAGAMQ